MIPLFASRSRRRSGVTLLELLAVLTVIGILAAIALGRSRTARDRAEVARLQAEARGLYRAQEAFRAETGAYYPGPFTPVATAAARFDFSVPPGRTVLVDEAGQDVWRGQLVVDDGSGGADKSAASCVITLGMTPSGPDEGVACSVPGDRPSELPSGGSVTE